MFQLNVFAFNVAEIAEGFPQNAQINVFLLGAAAVPEHANNWDLFRGLLRAGGERPGRRSAAEHGYELPPSDADCHLTRLKVVTPYVMPGTISRLKIAVCDLLQQSVRDRLNVSSWPIATRRLRMAARRFRAQSGNGAIITPMRRFPPPWTIEENNNACFIVRDSTGQALAYVYLRGRARVGARRPSCSPGTEARRMAATFAKLPELLRCSEAA